MLHWALATELLSDLPTVSQLEVRRQKLFLPPVLWPSKK